MSIFAIDLLFDEAFDEVSKNIQSEAASPLCDGCDGEPMTDIEKRLKTLEQRARIDDERWQMLDAQMLSFGLILKAIGRPIGIANPAILKTIIANLRTYEDVARVQNEHAVTIRHLRETRLFFESLVKGNTSGGRTLTNDKKPPQEK